MPNLSGACSKPPRHAYQRRPFASFSKCKTTIASPSHIDVYRYNTEVLNICARLTLPDAEAPSGVLILTLH